MPKVIYTAPDPRNAIFFVRCQKVTKDWLTEQKKKGKWKSMADLFEKLIAEAQARGEKGASRKKSVSRSHSKTL